MMERKKTNIARSIYPSRILGYCMATINVLLHHYLTRDNIALHIWIFCTIYIVYPHVVYYAALHTKTTYRKAEEINLLIDQVLITSIVYGFDLNFIGLFLYYLNNSALNYSVGGIKLFFKGWLVALVSFPFFYFFYPFDINATTSMISYVPAIIFLTVSIHILSRQIYIRGTYLKRMKTKLTAKNEALLVKTKELEDLNKEILYQSEQIIKQHNIIQKSSTEVNSSIEYSKRIQKAAFMEFDRSKFDDFFVIYKPKDMISGDFYKCFHYQGKTVFLVADCTGHGVPGALMSMIGSVLLDQIIKINKVMDPVHILYFLQDRINNTLQHEQNNLRDGMVVSICSVEDYEPGQKAKGKVTFAGASSPLIYVKNNEINLIKGDKFMIGGFNYSNKKISFTAHTIEIDQPVSLYLFSDGYQDQFGGPNKRKFGSRRFKNLIMEHSQKPMNSQKKILTDTMIDWIEISQEVQIDDITVMGVRLGR